TTLFRSRVLRERLWSGLAPVDRHDFVRVRKVDDHEAAAADTGHVRLGDPERCVRGDGGVDRVSTVAENLDRRLGRSRIDGRGGAAITRSEEHTSELQSRGHLVCRLLLEKKKNNAA